MLRSQSRVAGWGCSRCRRKETVLPETPEPERRRLRGCDGPAPSSFAVQGAPSVLRCPWATVLAGHEAEVVGWWQRWRLLGVWPFEGGADEQPAWVTQAFEALAAEDARAAAQTPQKG